MIYLNEIPLTNVSVLKLKEEQEEHRTRHPLYTGKDRNEIKGEI